MLKLDRWFLWRFAISLAVMIGATPARVAAHEDTLRLVQTFNKSELVYRTPFSPQGVLAVITRDVVQLWDSRTRRVKATLPNHNKILHAFFSSDGSTFITATKEKAGNITRFWDVQTGQLKVTLNGFIVFGPDKDSASKSVITLCDQDLKFWNGDTGELQKTVALYKRSFSNITDDGRLVVKYGGKKALLWEAATGRLIAELKPPQKRDYIVPWYVDIKVWDAVFSPDKKILATADNLNSIQLWDTDTGRMRALLEGHSSTIYGLAFSRDGRLLASASRDGTARLWDVETGQLKHRFAAGKEIARRVEFNPAGTALAVGYHTQARLWDVATGQVIVNTTTHSDVNRFVLFGTYWDAIDILLSPDGRLLLTIGDKSIKVWNSRTGELVTTLEGAHAPAAFSPDGKILAASGRNETVSVWTIG